MTGYSWTSTPSTPSIAAAAMLDGGVEDISPTFCGLVSRKCRDVTS